MPLFGDNQAARAELKRTLKSLSAGSWQRELFSVPDSNDGVALVCTYKSRRFLVDLPYLFGLTLHPEFGTLACVRVTRLDAVFINIVEYIANLCRASATDMYDTKDNSPEVKDGYLVFRSFDHERLRDNGPEDVAAATAAVFAAKIPARRGEKAPAYCLVVRWTYENGDVYYQKLWAAITPDTPSEPGSLYVEFPVPVLNALRKFSVPALGMPAGPQRVGAPALFTAVRRLTECYDPASQQFNVGTTEAVYVDQEDLIDLGVFAEEEGEYWRQRVEANEQEEQEGAEASAQQQGAAVVAAQDAQQGIDDGVEGANALMQSLAVGDDGQGGAPAPGGQGDEAGADGAGQEEHMDEDDHGNAYAGQEYDGTGDQAEAEETQPVGTGLTAAPAAPFPIGVSDLLSVVLGGHVGHGVQPSGHGQEAEGDEEERVEVVHVHSPQPTAEGGHPAPAPAVAQGPVPAPSPSSSSSTSSGHKRGRAESPAGAQKSPRLSDASTHAGSAAEGSVHGGLDTADDAVEVEEVVEEEGEGEHPAGVSVLAARIPAAASGVVDLYYSDDDADSEGQKGPRGAQLNASSPGNTGLGAAAGSAQMLAENLRLLQELKQAQAALAHSKDRMGVLEQLAAEKSEEAASAKAELAAVRESSISKAQHVAALQAVQAEANAAVEKERARASNLAAALAVRNHIASELEKAQAALKQEVQELKGQHALLGAALELERQEKLEFQELLRNTLKTHTDAQSKVLAMAQERGEALRGLGQAREELRQLQEAHGEQQRELEALRGRVAELEAARAEERASFSTELEAEKERLQAEMKADMEEKLAGLRKSELQRLTANYTVKEGLLGAPTGQGSNAALVRELKQERDKSTELKNKLSRLQQERDRLKERCDRCEAWKAEKIKSCRCKREQ